MADRIHAKLTRQVDVTLTVSLLSDEPRDGMGVFMFGSDAEAIAVRDALNEAFPPEEATNG